MKRIILSILLFTLCASFAFAQTEGGDELKPHQLTIQEKKFDFEQLLNLINIQYGPRYYKEQKLGIRLNDLAESYWNEIRETKSNGEFYSLIMQFVAEFQDGHFRVALPSKVSASLPFDATKVGDQIVIESVDRSLVSKEDFPFERGDQIIAMDGRPIDEIVAELKKYITSGNERSREMDAIWNITFRSGKKGPVPAGHMSVTILPQHSDVARTIELKWVQKGRPYDEHILDATNAMTSIIEPYDDKKEESHDPSNLSIIDQISEYRRIDSYICSGGTRIDIPKDATILIDDPFVAYYHPTEKGNLGYLRIPHYSPNKANINVDQWLDKYEWAVTQLEKNTEGLIIDQDHNCGGDVLVLEETISYFMDREFTPLQFRYRASKKMLLKWENAYTNAASHTINEEAWYENYILTKEAIDRGDYLTDLTSVRGNQEVYPKNIYTKPVIILIDFMAASGGDAFPAMMQGFGRAKLLGTRTMGLGGSTTDYEPLFYSQIKIDMTNSLFYAPDGSAIENVGAIPDIPYEITMDDFLYGYRNYQAFYENELFKMIP